MIYLDTGLLLYDFYAMTEKCPVESASNKNSQILVVCKLASEVNTQFYSEAALYI